MVTDARTTNRNYPKNSVDNTVAEDFARGADALDMVDADVAALMTSVSQRALLAHGHAISEVSALQSALDDKASASHTHALADLSDADIGAVTNGKWLRRISGKWSPASIAAGDVSGLGSMATESTSGYVQKSGGAAILPGWANDAGRPASPSNGWIGYNTDRGLFEGYQGGAWNPIGSSSARGETVFSAGTGNLTAGQTTFTVPGGYTVGKVDVLRNGVDLIVGSGVTASNGTTVVLATAALSTDVIKVRTYVSTQVLVKSDVGLGLVDNLPSALLTTDIATTPVPSVVVAIETVGYSAAGDGGGARFVRDASGTFTSSDGAKWRIANPWVTPKMFGAAGNGVADDLAAVQAAWDHSGTYRVPCRMLGLSYNCSGSLFTSSNLNVLGDYAVMYITAWPSVGGFINNVRPTAADRIQSNIYIEKLITDGSKLSAPTSGQNCNLGPEFAWGASNVRVVDCIARKIRSGTGGGTGGAGFGGEQGLENVVFERCLAEDCFRGLRVAGIPGSQTNGALKRAVGVVFRDCTTRRCGAAFFAHSVGDDNDDQSDLAIFDVLVDGLYVENCGHQAWYDFDFVTYPTIDAQKSGIIVLGGAQNIQIKNVRIKITSTYTTSDVDWLGRSGYPDSGTSYIGAGLSGNVGAVVWGWGQNVVIDGVTLDGAVDIFVKNARAIALGDLSTQPPTYSTGTVRQFVVRNLRHVHGGQPAYCYDAQASIDNTRMSVLLEDILRFVDFSGGVVGSNGTSGLTNVRIGIIDNTGRRLAGTVAEWIAYGNAVPASSQINLNLAGYDVGGGYSATGARAGQSYDAAAGYLRSSQNASTTKYHHAFYNTNGLVGGITTASSATTFATTSDETLKNFEGDYSPDEAIRVIRADPVRRYSWKRSGEPGIGWGAQSSYRVSQDLAVPGGWHIDATGEEVPEGVEGAVYRPWAIDKAARTPYLWAAVAGILDKLDAALARIEALESKLARKAR